MSMKINDHVTWVGKIDWELKKFHGEEYSTHRGTSYNSYLIRDKKTVLIDTVWMPFAKEFVQNLKKEIDLSKIDYIIANHAEVDHSGALPELMKEIPDTPIYCTKNGIQSLKGHYHQDWNFVEVKTGDKLNIGDRDLIFLEARMLHWPDSMFVYMTEDNILFSNDAFGQHYASESLYNDTVDQAELFQEAIKYYANILTPFSPLVTRKIEEVLSFNLPVNMICTSHGVIWQDNPVQIVEQYLKWADDYQEDQVTLVYDSMWRGTSRMAEGIAEGLKKSMPGTTIKLIHAGLTDKNDVITELFKSKAFLVGSSTINKGILSSIAAVMEMVKGLKFKNKKGAAFGSYGWSGESVPLLEKLLAESGIDVTSPGIKELWNPDEDAMARCVAYGEALGKTL
ncbi:MAG: anaerobic nitric oxide reductase flavorubredoxin [Bacillota bacterium]|nr:anaerobic nitric oxide reductase flavorubredoxin [Bacillota bacterium]MDW7676442.1 anaerobic nitric oxide reductase flavorubredoxin [Bacillota bacterium]